jgi:lipid-A-disaccharide synthase
MLRIGIVAGEASGDFLGSHLIASLKSIYSDIEVIGIGGNMMENAGCQCIYPSSRLSVMGISEVFSKFMGLISIRSHVRKFYLENPPDVFIGIDAPDFNFPLEKALKKAGIRTIHYVSPSVWAWREYRLASIAKCIDLMLTLFPFEAVLYEKYGITARFVGHPLANIIPMKTDKHAARKALGLPEEGTIIALFPGSRSTELNKLVIPFLETANWCRNKLKNVLFICNLVNESDLEYVQSRTRETSHDINMSLFTGKSLTVMAAADVVLLASGTASLEAMLIKRPMVVAYKVNWLTYQIAKRLIHIPYVSLPNLLAGRKIIMECLQENCQPEIMGNEIISLLNDKNRVSELIREFENLHKKISAGPSDNIANIILDFVYK